MNKYLRNLMRHPFWRDNSGAPVVEFAIVAPFLILLTVGIIDVGRAVWTWTTIEHVARETTRYAAVRGSDHVNPATLDTVTAYAESQATGLNTDDLTITITWNDGNNATGSRVTVNIAVDFSLLLGGFINYESVALESNSTMVIL